MGYLHNTSFSQIIPCTAMHGVIGAYTQDAGQTANTICLHRAAAASTGVVNIPITILSNESPLKGAYLQYIHVDYELTDDVAVSVTAVLNKIVQGADGAAPTVTQPAITQSLTAGGTAITLDHHKMVITLTTPVWVDDADYYLLAMSFECGAAVEVDVQSAVAYFTEKL